MRPRGRWAAIRRYAVGGSLAAGGVLLGLGASGGLSAWWELLTHYVPLYGQQAGTMVFVETARERWELIRGYALDERVHPTTALWPIAAWLVLRTRITKHSTWGRIAIASSALWAAGWLYVLTRSEEHT